MSTIRMSGRSTTLPGDQTLAGTTGALEERAFSTEAVENVDDPRDAVLARIRKGSPVLNNTSVTLGRPASPRRSTVRERTRRCARRYWRSTVNRGLRWRGADVRMDLRAGAH
jgi:hypothetical protein